MFDNQESISLSNVNQTIRGYASVVGVSQGSIDECMSTPAPWEEVRRDQSNDKFETTVGRSEFVSGTPSTVLQASKESTGRALVGARDFSQYANAIEFLQQ